jgi:hypothetical protein
MADANATGREDWPEQCGRECPPSEEGISSLGGRSAVPCEAGEIMGDTDCGRQSSGIDIRGGIETIIRGEGDIEQTDGSVGDTEGRDGFGSAQRDPRHAAQSDEGMGDTEEQRCGRLDDEQGAIGGRDARGHIDWASNPEQQGQWQIKPALGRNVDGTARGLDYAELSVSCDNRTDELRLLGNGVVPATATLAFRTLLQEIISA